MRWPVRNPMRMRAAVMVAILLPVLLAMPATANSARPPFESAQLAASLDRVLDRALRATGAPGAQAAVYRCGGLVWSGSAGVVDLKSRRPVTPATRFVIASATKSVTATLVMQLVERGALSLDTRLADFYPDLPNAQSITVRMLLTHTSGLSEYFADPRFDRTVAEDPGHRWTRDEVLGLVHRPLFAPGARFRYTNTNYVVLGGLIEKTGGVSIEDAFQASIGEPLALTNSTFEYRPAESSLFAHPHEVGRNGVPRDQYVRGLGIRSDVWGETWTDGGLATTAQELARFGDALFAGRLVTRATLRTMTTLDRFGGGLGLFPKRFNRHRWLGHDGSYGGFESENWHDAARGVTIAVTVNMDEAWDDPFTSLSIWKAVTRAYDRLAAGEPVACQ